MPGEMQPRIIDNFNLTVDIGNDIIVKVPPNLEDRKGSSNWKIIGIGKQKHIIDESGYTYTNIYIKSGVLSYKKKNFKPKRELFISWSYNPSFRIDDISENFYIRRATYLLEKLNIKELKQYLKYLNKNQLRISRNYLFARKGYIFKSKDLYDYFSNKVWYIPNPNITNDIKELNEKELDIFNLVCDYEKKL